MSTSARSSRRSQPSGSLNRTSGPNSSQLNMSKLSIPLRSAAHPQSSMQIGIQGSAMTLPTPRPSSQIRRQSMPASSRDSPSVSHEACEKEKRLLLSREKQLKAEIAQLQRKLAELTREVDQKKDVIQTLTAQNNAVRPEQEAAAKAEREKEASRQQELEALRSQLQNTLEQLHETEQGAKTKVEQLQKEMADMIAAKDREIADRDQAIQRLKMQMTDSLKDGSLERKQQLAELGQELMSLRKECFTLRNEIKTVGSTKSKDCSKCAEAVSRAEKLAMTLKEREVTIQQLKKLCTRFETQLSQQDVLLKQWADSKGHSVQLP